MLTKIIIDGVATFRTPATLDTDKKTNLLYGLNGSGKSTIARYLRRPADPAFHKCSAAGREGKKILVFNEDFIRENFYESPTIKGIFSLSKKNKEAEEKIATARAERDRLEAARTDRSSEHTKRLNSINEAVAKIIDATFEIKRKHAGGDRVLEFCLSGLMTNREKLFDHLKSIDRPNERPGYSATDLQNEVRMLGKAGESTPEPHLPTALGGAAQIESHPSFRTAIVGTENSSLGEAIKRLQNADWVRSGVAYLDLDLEKPQACPFCQKLTIDKHFAEEIRAYFDKSYDDQISVLKQHNARYAVIATELPTLASLQASKFYDEQIDSKYTALEALLSENRLLIEAKLKSPSLAVDLKSTNAAFTQLNEVIEQVNQKISEYNTKLANRESALADIKLRFWKLMRWEYDNKVSSYIDLQSERLVETSTANLEIQGFDAQTAAQNAIIQSAQKETVNVDDAIARINAELVDLGVLDFRIAKHSHHLYQLERPGSGVSPFHSLSEGEKMMIALLYFCELCDGNEAEDEAPSDRIVVIDDPISSMSHIYIFNVGRLLRNRLIEAKHIRQLFIFTHSLYFFYELTDTDHKRRSASQALFRVSKSPGGSAVTPMKYEDIQNDYQAYWQIINDDTQHPALIANCMRNVVEYFFGFVEKQSYANVFQKPELSKIGFQAFNRYMNRESHSFGQNVFDLKEFDYQDFREGLRQVFDTCGYAEHFKQMARIQ